MNVKEHHDNKQEKDNRPLKIAKAINIEPDIYQFLIKKPGCNVYLIKGNIKNVLIDTGAALNLLLLKDRLFEIGLRVKDINLILLTHEHYDHTGATAFYYKTAVVAAHRLAANKLEMQDEFVTFSKYRDIPSKPFWVDIWLEDGSIIDLGNYKLQVIHTPGHTSGCVCFYEPTRGLLFSGDTVFAGGTLSEIAVGGNVSDYVHSVQRLSTLKIRKIYPGHGRISETPDKDIPKAMTYAQTLLDGSKLFFEAFIKTRELHKTTGSAFGYWTETQRF